MKKLRTVFVEPNDNRRGNVLFAEMFESNRFSYSIINVKFNMVIM